MTATMPTWLLEKLRSPDDGSPLSHDGASLRSEHDSSARFAIIEPGIPALLPRSFSDATAAQLDHFDHVAQGYMRNLAYPHTVEYMHYLDSGLRRTMPTAKFGETLELCCGAGEALHLLQQDVTVGVGVDVSIPMLRAARARLPESKFAFLQADATKLPFERDSFDSAIILGGIHHVPNRSALFSEIHRVLRAGGRLVFREPIDDFAPWRWLRRIVYRVSPALDHTTEHPLRRDETVTQLASAGLQLEAWRGFGFIGFCLFMNSDVLVANRLFRFVPGIRGIVRIASHIDEAIVRGGSRDSWGLLAVGVARK